MEGVRGRSGTRQLAVNMLMADTFDLSVTHQHCCCRLSMFGNAVAGPTALLPEELRIIYI